MEENLANDDRIVIYGEDVRDPYGGAFKATKGLSEIYDNRIVNMPISEACMVGMGVGLALGGMLPVVEMMFGDFITLGFDQILNHAVKYGWVYDVNVPIVIRLPMGAKRGYGPTHSQSLEKYLAAIPGLNVIALSVFHDPKIVYDNIFNNIVDSIAVIENKKLYAERIKTIDNDSYRDFYVQELNNYGFSTFCFSLEPDDEPDMYILSYGGMSEDCINASVDLMMEEEILADVIIISSLSPIPVRDISVMIKNKKPLIIVEEGSKTLGIGAEIAAVCIENDITTHISRVAAYDMPIPNGILLESQMIPNKERIVEEGRKVCR